MLCEIHVLFVAILVRLKHMMLDENKDKYPVKNNQGYNYKPNEH